MMASIRKQPFGYWIVCGESVPHEGEVETVRWIFDSYLAGASYSTLVGALQERGVPYDVGKDWNKNMVARILEDRRLLWGREIRRVGTTGIICPSASASSSQVPYRSLLCKHKSSFTSLLLLSPQEFHSCGVPK